MVFVDSSTARIPFPDTAKALAVAINSLEYVERDIGTMQRRRKSQNFTHLIVVRNKNLLPQHVSKTLENTITCWSICYI